MTKIYSLVVFFFLTSVCNHAFGQTQAEMNQTAIASYKIVDAELNTTYNKLLKTLSPKERKLLITAQKHWIAFRDAHCAFEVEEFDGGSIQPLLFVTCKEECTRNRIEELNESIRRKK